MGTNRNEIRRKYMRTLFRATSDNGLCRVLNISQDKLINHIFEALEITGSTKQEMKAHLVRFGPFREKTFGPPDNRSDREKVYKPTSLDNL